MVKFSKELEAQLVPEWKDAFVNYRKLKKHIKKIKFMSTKSVLLDDEQHDHDHHVSDHDHDDMMSTKSRSRASMLIDFVRVSLSKQVDEVNNTTEFLHHESAGHEMMNKFYEMIHDELNKVNQFYIAKETEVHERADFLINKQQYLALVSDQYRDSTPPQTDNAADKNGVKDKSRTTVRIDDVRPNAQITSILWDDVLNINPKNGEYIDISTRKQIQCAEKMTRDAFVELYRALGFLKTYRSLNKLAFRKILKKFDKVSNQQASTSYNKVMKQSYFTNSDTVVRLMDEVESLFTKHFAKSDRETAMKFLRPQPRHKRTHRLTNFFVGLFTGSFVSLLGIYAILACLSGVFSSSSANSSYLETVYPFFSMFVLLSLHVFMYGCNLFMWKKIRINYNFIFEFQQPSNALKYRDAFFICTTLMTATFGAMTLHIILLSTNFSPHRAELIPGILLLCFILILICPLNLFYRPTRYFFLKVVWNTVFSPFYKVPMVDVFMADQLTSQIPLLRHMESASCYFLTGSFEMHCHETCKSRQMNKELVYVISFAPYYWRAMQCARKWYDECNNGDQVANLGKYVSAMVAAGARLTYNRQHTQLWMVIAVMTSLMATVYQLYWDFVKDWGLLNPKSKNPWLRDDLMLKNKRIYYASIALNLVLRVAWVESVMKFNAGMLESRLLEFSLASLEVVRRGHWNFYRLENKHLNNVGEFKAVKEVPLVPLFRGETNSDR